MPMSMLFTANVNLNVNLIGLCRGGRLKEALHILLTTRNPPANSPTYIQLLQACISKKALSEGKQIHSHITHMGFAFGTSTFFQNNLINLYAKCGSLVDARKVFDNMTERDLISWNMIIAAYKRDGYPHQALTLFHQMQRTGIDPDQFTFASILPACATINDLEQGMGIHQSIMEKEFLSDEVANALVHMYSKCGSVHKARELFDKMPRKDVVSWTAMVAGYAQNGDLDEASRLFKEMPQRNVISWNAMIAGYAQNRLVEKALETFKQMQLAGVKPVSTTFASILPACSKMGDLKQGVDIHQSIIESGLYSDVVVASALVDMYAKCGSIHKARDLFDRMPQRDKVSWNAMIAGYSHNGLFAEALDTFKKMQLAGLKPDFTTFASILPACAKVRALEQGMDIHQSIIKSGLLSDVVVASTLVDMYGKCGSLHKARQLFDKMPQKDVVSWTAMIAGYAQSGFAEKAFETFKQMQFAGVKPVSTTFASILPACAKMAALEQSMDIHQSIIESNFSSDVVVASALVDVYAKCGSIHKACEVFDKMPQRNVVSWNAMIAGYVQNGFVEKALETFKRMRLVGVKPISTTFASILPGCAKMGALEWGMDIHQSIIKSGFVSNFVVASALVDMYAKCGSVHKAHELFGKIPQKTLISWNAMTAGYAQNGFCKDALKLFELMKHSGTCPDHVSFTCVLLACSHAGLVDEGCKYFKDMSDSYFITPTIDHYVCMVDLLGRAGHLEETLNLIIKIPIKPVGVVWTCLLGACRQHKNIVIGEFTANLLFELDPKNPATYVLLANTYAEVGRWGEVQMVRGLMKDRGIKKTPGCSWIEDHKSVHVFCVGNRSHPQTQAIYAKL